MKNPIKVVGMTANISRDRSVQVCRIPPDGEDDDDESYQIVCTRVDGAVITMSKVRISREATVALVDLLGMQGIYFDATKIRSISLEIPEVTYVPETAKENA